MRTWLAALAVGILAFSCEVDSHNPDHANYSRADGASREQVYEAAHFHYGRGAWAAEATIPTKESEPGKKNTDRPNRVNIREDLFDLFAVMIGWLLKEWHHFTLTVFTLALVWATVSLRDSTDKLWTATQKLATDADTAATRTSEHFRASERAYITMSHHHPGLEHFAKDKDGEGFDLQARIRVTNHGKTPGTVTAISFRLMVYPIDAIPPAPDYGEGGPEGDPGAFLVAGDGIDLTIPLWISNAAMKAAEGGHVILLIGFVDYMDGFGGRYRGGYARRHDLRVRDGENNLLYFFDRAYGYDRVREAGEGRDWPEAKA